MVMSTKMTSINVEHHVQYPSGPVRLRNFKFLLNWIRLDKILERFHRHFRSLYENLVC
jgi:hypothetical protein